jgi:hypothetical protein
VLVKAAIADPASLYASVLQISPDRATSEGQNRDSGPP